jgi:GTPase SAR1 family protein
MATKILLIGKPHSGKTTFIVQLYARVETNNSALKLYKAVENLTPIIEATRALANGEEVKPTPTDKSTVICLPLQHGEVKIDLDCPDYGGEQVNHIIENKEVDSKWVDLIKQSENWILFIKPTDLNTSYDLSNKTIKPEVLEKGKGKSEEYSVSDQSYFIELLQILLHTKGQDSHFRNSKTKLTIVLTCWDELASTSTPRKELNKILPLLLNFIETNWIESKVNILGLSSLGFSLKNQENKIKYQETGSEHFGYMLKSNGTKDDDITQLIIEAVT